MSENAKRVIAVALLLWILTVTCNLPTGMAQPTSPSSEDIANTAVVKAMTAQASIAPTTMAIEATTTPPPMAPTDTQCTAMITANMDANVRSGPGTAYEIVGYIPTGGTAVVAGRNDSNTWWHIQFAGGNGGHAWIAGSVVTPSCIPPSVQVVAAPPLPTSPPPTNTETVSIPPLLIITLPPLPVGDIELQSVFLSTSGEVIARVAVNPSGSLSGNVTYKVWKDGSLQVTTTKALPSGSIAYWTGVFVSGTHNIRIAVDTNNAFAETNEGNNSWQGNLTK